MTEGNITEKNRMRYLLIIPRKKITKCYTLVYFQFSINAKVIILILLEKTAGIVISKLENTSKRKVIFFAD